MPSHFWWHVGCGVLIALKIDEAHTANPVSGQIILIVSLDQGKLLKDFSTMPARYLFGGIEIEIAVVILKSALV